MRNYWLIAIAGHQDNASTRRSTSAAKAPQVWRAPESAAAVPVGGGAWLRGTRAVGHVGDDGTAASQISHVIYGGHFSR